MAITPHTRLRGDRKTLLEVGGSGAMPARFRTLSDTRGPFATYTDYLEFKRTVREKAAGRKALGRFHQTTRLFRIQTVHARLTQPHDARLP